MVCPGLFRCSAVIVFALVCAAVTGRQGEARPFDEAVVAQLQAAIDDVRDELGIPAVSAAVISADNATWSGASGFSDVENDIEADSGTLFSVGSLTKTFIAVLTLRLVEEGTLCLDDTLGEWLDDLPLCASRRIDPAITVRQLLNHTSGIATYTDRLLLWMMVHMFPDRAWQHEDVLRFIGPPRFEPGTSWEYSNSNYYLLGMIIEAATGTPVAEVLHRSVLEPLGLRQTFLEGEEPVPAGIARGYRLTGGEPVPEPLSVERTANYSVAWTAGALAATAADVARLAHAVLGGNALSDSLRAAMLDFVPAGAGDNGYGLGISRTTHAGYGTLWLHNGAIQGYAARLVHVPALGVSIAVQINMNISDTTELDAVTNALLPVLD